jgi:hypothetical protein
MRTRTPNRCIACVLHLPRASYTIRDYSESENPPILHRKETFVDPLYPEYGMFAELTGQDPVILIRYVIN